MFSESSWISRHLFCWIYFYFQKKNQNKTKRFQNNQKVMQEIIFSVHCHCFFFWILIFLLESNTDSSMMMTMSSRISILFFFLLSHSNQNSRIIFIRFLVLFFFILIWILKCSRKKTEIKTFLITDVCVSVRVDIKEAVEKKRCQYIGNIFG